MEVSIKELSYNLHVCSYYFFIVAFVVEELQCTTQGDGSARSLLSYVVDLKLWLWLVLGIVNTMPLK